MAEINNLGVVVDNKVGKPLFQLSHLSQSDSKACYDLRNVNMSFPEEIGVPKENREIYFSSDGKTHAENMSKIGGVDILPLPPGVKKTLFEKIFYQVKLNPLKKNVYI